MRSLILAPGDDGAKLAAALRSEADAVVIDLDVAADVRGAAREAAARAFKEGHGRAGGPALMARVSPLEAGETDADLAAIMPFSPAAIVLPRTLGAASVQRLAAKLAVAEARSALDDGATAILAVIDTAEGALAAASLRGAGARLIGLAWDPNALAADIGAEAARDADGAWIGPIRQARDFALLAAAAAGVAAVDAAFAGGDAAALQAEALAARRDGFAAKFALDAAQAKVINAVFGAVRKTGR